MCSTTKYGSFMKEYIPILHTALIQQYYAYEVMMFLTILMDKLRYMQTQFYVGHMQIYLSRWKLCTTDDRTNLLLNMLQRNKRRIGKEFTQKCLKLFTEMWTQVVT
jgi:histidyl-tRNA synthetase